MRFTFGEIRLIIKLSKISTEAIEGNSRFALDIFKQLNKEDVDLNIFISPLDIIMYLINAIYFKGDWAEQFDKKNTSNTQFHSEDGSIGYGRSLYRCGRFFRHP